MNVWTGLAVAILCSAQVFGQPTLNAPSARGSGEPRLRNATSITAPSYKSPTDPLITWSQGFLALVRADAPNDTILRWDADTVECPNSVQSVYLHPKNFGPEEITLCAPVEPESPQFSRFTDCDCYNSLGPYQMSPCSLRIEFHPDADGTFLDTLRIQTDSWNSYGGFVRIALSGTSMSTPESPNVVIGIEGVNAHLYWNPIHQSEGGCPTTVPGYLVFYSPDNSTGYRLLNYTTDTTYVHLGVILQPGGLFYQVVAGTGSEGLMRTLPRNGIMEDVLSLLKQR